MFTDRNVWLRSVLLLVSWCFEPGQSQRITSGLKETFMKVLYNYIVERTSKAEIRPEEQSEKAGRVVWRIYGVKYS